MYDGYSFEEIFSVSSCFAFQNSQNDQVLLEIYTDTTAKEVNI